MLRWEEEEARWEPPEPRFARYRFPSSNQLRIIAVLADYAPDPQRGLPDRAVRKISGIADKSNARRAVRALLSRGIIQRTRDEERLRLTPRAFGSAVWDLAAGSVRPPLDDARAKAVLDAFGETGGGSRKADTPWSQ